MSTFADSPSMRSSLYRVGLSLVLLSGLVLAACQSDTSPDQAETEPMLPDDELVIEDSWVRPAASGDSTALYMTIANGLSDPDTLLGARAPIFDRVAFVNPSAENMDGTQLDSLLIVPARTRLTLQPDSQQVVIRGLSQALQEGDTLLITLDFAQSGLQQVRAPVRTGAPMDEQ